MARLNKIFAAGLGLVVVFVLSGCGGIGLGIGDKDRQRHGDGTPTAQALNNGQETQRIGKEGIGFVDVPADYIKFIDVDGNDSIQYSDVTGTDIFTLNVVDFTGMSAEERAAFTLRTGAENLAARIQEEGATDINARLTTLAGHDAAEVYGTYPDATILFMILVEDDAGEVHYISVESPNKDTLIEMVTLVEDTYAFDS